MSLRRLIRSITPALLATALSTPDSVARSPLPESPDEVLSKGAGICCLLGEGSGARAVELAVSSSWIFYAQVPNHAEYDAASRSAHERGVLGSRVFLSVGPGSQIHLADHIADLLLVRGDEARSVGADKVLLTREIDRVVRPGGLVYEKGSARRRPTPKGFDDWSHPYHGVDNNPQSKDQLARSPYLTRFLATPWYGPMPEITLSSGGRLFKAFGHLAFKEREWPMLGKLIALNAFNGTELWRRDLRPGFMIHRNTMIATPGTLYLADDTSCQLIDAASGKTRAEIAAPPDVTDGPVWKWMALEGDTLYALIGEKEELHEVHRGTRKQTGWPWTTVRNTYGKQQKTWGHGRTLIAFDIETRKPRWIHREEKPIDGRAVSMTSDRIFIYSHQNSLAAIDTKTGKPRWRTSDRKLLDAIGPHHRAQQPNLGYATSSYMKCTDDVVLFAGPQRRKLVAVSARDGYLLWTRPDGNMQLVLRDDGIYAMGRMTSSKKLDYRSGKVLAELDCFRGNCTRATGAIDSIFARGYRHTGTLRYDVEGSRPLRLPAMRPACQDGVVIANGQLYWGPWMCDCNHSLVGVISLGSAGAFEFTGRVFDEQRLEDWSPLSLGDEVRQLEDERPADWSTYRKDNRRFASSPASVGKNVAVRWTYRAVAAENRSFRPTAPTAASGLVFLSGKDGAVHAIDAKSGKNHWTSFTGGAVRYPPTYSKRHVLVGSGDGFVYRFDARTGKLAWRYRVAPFERRLPAYGSLLSTWPVASGVLVEDGVAYAAAGIVSHDGTHLVALNASTGRLRWRNDDSGNLLGEDGAVVGVNVQGHFLSHGGKLYLAGGNVTSPAIFDQASGKCLNELDQKPAKTRDDHWKMQRSSRGSELSLVGDRIIVTGRMLYSPETDGPRSRYNELDLRQARSDDVIIWATSTDVARVDRAPNSEEKPKELWRKSRWRRIDALALAEDRVIVAGLTEKPTLALLSPDDGDLAQEIELPTRAVASGLAVDRDGRVLVSLRNGTVVCIASANR